MESSYNLALRINKKLKEKGSTESEKIAWIEGQISWHINDTLKLIKNINETSYNKEDRISRVFKMEEDYGIPKTHLIL